MDNYKKPCCEDESPLKYQNLFVDQINRFLDMYDKKRDLPIFERKLLRVSLNGTFANNDPSTLQEFLHSFTCSTARKNIRKINRSDMIGILQSQWRQTDDRSLSNHLESLSLISSECVTPTVPLVDIFQVLVPTFDQTDNEDDDRRISKISQICSSHPDLCCLDIRSLVCHNLPLFLTFPNLRNGFCASLSETKQPSSHGLLSMVLPLSIVYRSGDSVDTVYQLLVEAIERCHSMSNTNENIRFSYCFATNGVEAWLVSIERTLLTLNEIVRFHRPVLNWKETMHFFRLNSPSNILPLWTLLTRKATRSPGFHLYQSDWFTIDYMMRTIGCNPNYCRIKSLRIHQHSSVYCIALPQVADIDEMGRLTTPYLGFYQAGRHLILKINKVTQAQLPDSTKDGAAHEVLIYNELHQRDLNRKAETEGKGVAWNEIDGLVPFVIATLLPTQKSSGTDMTTEVLVTQYNQSLYDQFITNHEIDTTLSRVTYINAFTDALRVYLRNLQGYLNDNHGINSTSPLQPWWDITCQAYTPSPKIYPAILMYHGKPTNTWYVCKPVKQIIMRDLVDRVLKPLRHYGLVHTDVRFPNIIYFERKFPPWLKRPIGFIQYDDVEYSAYLIDYDCCERWTLPRSSSPYTTDEDSFEESFEEEATYLDLSAGREDLLKCTKYRFNLEMDMEMWQRSYDEIVDGIGSAWIYSFSSMQGYNKLA